MSHPTIFMSHPTIFMSHPTIFMSHPTILFGVTLLFYLVSPYEVYYADCNKLDHNRGWRVTKGRGGPDHLSVILVYGNQSRPYTTILLPYHIGSKKDKIIMNWGIILF